MKVEFKEKIISVLFYLIPLKLTLVFGYHLTLQFPLLNYIKYITYPIDLIENILPFSNMLLLIIIFLGIIRNSKFSYFIRFNAFQSILLSIVLTITSYILLMLSNSFLSIVIMYLFSDLIYIIMGAIITFSFIKCIQGEEPDIPGISNAVRIQI